MVNRAARAIFAIIIQEKYLPYELYQTKYIDNQMIDCVDLEEAIHANQPYLPKEINEDLQDIILNIKKTKVRANNALKGKHIADCTLSFAILHVVSALRRLTTKDIFISYQSAFLKSLKQYMDDTPSDKSVLYLFAYFKMISGFLIPDMDINMPESNYIINIL